MLHKTFFYFILIKKRRETIIILNGDPAYIAIAAYNKQFPLTSITGWWHLVAH